MRSLQPEHPSLREVQEVMAARILPTPWRSQNDTATLDGWLRLPDGIHAADRVRVYRDGYPARICDALSETYSAVADLVGEDAFAALADRYAGLVPLTSYNLNDAGAQLSEFLRHDRLCTERPYLPDLAALEWRVAVAFHAAERTALDPRTLAWTVEDWANAVLHFQPSVAVVSSSWPLLDLWSARNASRIAQNGPEHIIVRRAGLIVRCESVSAPEAITLQRLLNGHRLGESMERLEGDGDNPSPVREWFSRWIAAGMIVDAVLPP